MSARIDSAADGARRTPVAILISGRGSNMAALLAAMDAPDYPARCVLVLSNRPDAAGLAQAREKGVPTAVVDHRAHGARAAFEAAMEAEIARAGARLLCLAGFMRVLTADFVARWHDRIVNVHPSLLPAFRGLDTHARAIAAGVRIHGCTVHLVRPDVDEGPILMQAAVPVMPDDDEPRLAARVLAQEHRIFPAALRRLLEGAPPPPAALAGASLVSPPLPERS